MDSFSYSYDSDYFSEFSVSESINPKTFDITETISPKTFDVTETVTPTLIGCGSDPGSNPVEFGRDPDYYNVFDNGELKYSSSPNYLTNIPSDHHYALDGFSGYNALSTFDDFTSANSSRFDNTRALAYSNPYNKGLPTNATRHQTYVAGKNVDRAYGKLATDLNQNVDRTYGKLATDLNQNVDRTYGKLATDLNQKYSSMYSTDFSVTNPETGTKFVSSDVQRYTETPRYNDYTKIKHLDERKSEYSKLSSDDGISADLNKEVNSSWRFNMYKRQSKYPEYRKDEGEVKICDHISRTEASPSERYLGEYGTHRRHRSHGGASSRSATFARASASRDTKIDSDISKSPAVDSDELIYQEVLSILDQKARKFQIREGSPEIRRETMILPRPENTPRVSSHALLCRHSKWQIEIAL